MKAFNKKKRPKDSLKGKYRRICSGKYVYCLKSDRLLWNSVFDFRIKKEHMKNFTDGTKHTAELFNKLEVPKHFLLNFHRCTYQIREEE